MQGIDISDAQGVKTVAQFKALKAAGYSYVIVKTGEGGGTVAEARSYAKTAKTNIERARKAGLQVGPYHYFHPRSTRKGRDEARVALEAAKQAGWNPKTDKRFALDYETTHVGTGLETRRYALSAIRYVRRHTGLRKPWFYTYTSFWNQHGFWRPMGCRIWQAEYGPARPSRMRGLAPFGAALSPIKRWQFTSSGKVAGFHDGRLDVNKGER
jgi:GH25 family lysozyme M1 (1,4-beta-N-acetylmuramidase)